MYPDSIIRNCDGVGPLLAPLGGRKRREVNVLGDAGAIRPTLIPDAWDAERQLVRGLREALPVEVQTVFFREFDGLLALLAEPRCADAQADGVPCPQPDISCEECGRALAWVRELRAAIARSGT